MKDILTKILALAGTALVWLPILATLITALFGSLQSRELRFDYLMPAELFPAVLVGGLLLLWATWRAHRRTRQVLACLGGMAAVLLAGALLASASGLASGQREPAGWPWALVLGSITAYTLLVIVLGVTGVLLLRDLNQKSS
jgi:hypothetical protein